MDWFHRATDDFRFVRVGWDWEEAGEVAGVLGGSITESHGSSLKASGELDYLGDLREAIGHDLLRVYVDSSDGAEVETVALGTFLCSTDSTEHEIGKRQGNAKLYSTLKVLDDWCLHAPLTLPAGANVVSWVVANLFAVTPLVVSATPSPYAANAAHTFDAGTSLLEAVNWCADYIGYGSAAVDGYGTVVLAPYADPGSRSPVAVIADDEDGCFESVVDVERDDWNTPNCVVVTYEREDATMTAVASKRSGNDYSIDARHREITRVETVSDVREGSTDEEVMSALQAKADLLLETGFQQVERATIRHYWVPFSIGDVVRFKYDVDGYDQVMSVWSRKTDLVPGMSSETVLRKVVVA